MMVEQSTQSIGMSKNLKNSKEIKGVVEAIRSKFKRLL
jgi:hypothetical protein